MTEEIGPRYELIALSAESTVVVAFVPGPSNGTLMKYYSNTTCGAHIAARRKQYEFYRDRLLTFEEAV